MKLFATLSPTSLVITLLSLVLGGCGGLAGDTLHGYAEGDFVRLAQVSQLRYRRTLD